MRYTEDIAVHSRRLESLGFDYLAASEHVAFNTPTGNSFVSLSVAAGATEHIGLLSAVTVLPLYPPVIAAKLGAALDVASGGRFTMGVGVGGEYPPEFEACGVPVTQRGRRCDEALELIKRCWTEDAVDFTGEFTTTTGITIRPRPAQYPHPPIWISGRKSAAMRRAARFGDGWMPYLVSPEMLHDSIHEVRRMAESFDRDPSTITPAIFLMSCCHEDAEVARELAAKQLETQYLQDFRPFLDTYAMVGTPDDCQARVKEYIDAGVETVILGSSCPIEYSPRNEQLLASAVVSPSRT